MATTNGLVPKIFDWPTRKEYEEDRDEIPCNKNDVRNDKGSGPVLRAESTEDTIVEPENAEFDEGDRSGKEDLIDEEKLFVRRRSADCGLRAYAVLKILCYSMMFYVGKTGYLLRTIANLLTCHAGKVIACFPNPRGMPPISKRVCP